MFKAIFWDNDGVLVDTERLYFRATQQILDSVGIELTEDQYKELFLNQGRGAWHLAAERGLAKDAVERLRTMRNELYARWLVETPLVMEDIGRVLDALHGKYVMGVVTSSRKDHFDLIHRSTGLLKYFDFVLTASDVSRVKPDPELYRRAIEKSRLEPHACVAIEDSARGVRAATGAGIPCIVVPTPLTRGSSFPGAARVLERLTDLLTVL
jgi:HAD superfamily hydrolase (TIGR01509 family)